MGVRDLSPKRKSPLSEIKVYGTAKKILEKARQGG